MLSDEEKYAHKLIRQFKSRHPSTNRTKDAVRCAILHVKLMIIETHDAIDFNLNCPEESNNYLRNVFYKSVKKYLNKLL